MIDSVQLNFSPTSLTVLNIILALVMYGIALDLEVEDFKRVVLEPRGIAVGLTSQLVLLPAMTCLLAYLIDPAPSLALGMVLIAACPGGNMSNFFTHLGRGNTGLSITMTSFVTLGAVVFTPLNFSFWGSLLPSAQEMLRGLSLDPLRMMRVVGLIIIVPTAAGMWTRARRPDLADRMLRPFKIGSMIVFAAFIAIALFNNFGPFLEYLDSVFLIVIAHNALALSIGFGTATAAGLATADRRAVTMEVGIQNAGLGLLLIFNFFGGSGGMALVAAWWGLWHLVAGLTLGSIWARREPEPEPALASD